MLPLLPDASVVPEDPLVESVLVESVEVVPSPVEVVLEVPELLDALCVGFVVVVARWVGELDVVAEEVEVDVEAAIEDTDDKVVDAWTWRLWWCFTVAFVSVSDFGALATVVPETPTCGWTDDPLGDATDEAAGASRATTIAPVPSAAPTPVAAVTRRTRRRMRSRCAAATALPVVSMLLPLPPSLSRV